MYSFKHMTVRLPGLRTALAMLLAGGLCQSTELSAAEPPAVAEEYDLKAAFLFNLAKFVQWPPEKFAGEESALIIGIRGVEAVDRFTRLLRSKTIGKRKLIVQRLTNLAELPSCHIVFVCRSEKEDPARWTEAGKLAGALTVGETQQFLEQGGMIQFAMESQELRLEINEQCARKAGLTIMANVLATLVNKGIAKIRNF